MTAELIQFTIESAITVIVVFVALQAARYTAGKSSNWEWLSRSQYDPGGNNAYAYSQAVKHYSWLAASVVGAMRLPWIIKAIAQLFASL